MTAVQRFAEGIRTRLLAGRQRISRASVTALPWSRASIEMRNRNQAEMVRDYIHRGDSVLDVGCGAGYLTKCFEEMFGAEPTGLDVKDFRVASVAFREFDGTSIPFPDRSFDHVVLSFTLHHCHDPMRLIQKCRRVARRSILVFEDLPDGRFGRLLVFLHMEAFRRQYRLELRGGDYRSSLAWLGGKAVNVVQTAMPYEWCDRLYVPRFLHAYALLDD